MIGPLEQNKAIKERKRDPFASLPGLACLGLLTALPIWLGISVLKLFRITTLNTLELYALLQDVNDELIDESIQGLMLYVLLFGMMAFVTGILFMRTCLALRRFRARTGSGRSGMRETETKEGDTSS